MLSYSVSQLDRFREWEEDEEATLEDLIQDLERPVRNEDMKRGEAFHAALEHLGTSEVDEIESRGFRFIFSEELEINLPEMREVRGSKTYNGLRVNSRVDSVVGKRISDHKAATWLDAERYFKKYQWRYYLDIFNADVFRWNIWEMQETDEARVYAVRDLHVIEQYRYPGLERDCYALAARMKDFAERYLVKPDKLQQGLFITAKDVA